MDQNELAAGVDALIAIQNHDQFFDVVANHPVLLTDMAREELDRLARLQAELEAVQQVRFFNAMLVACRKYGMPQVRADFDLVWKGLDTPIEELLTLRDDEQILDFLEQHPDYIEPAGLHSLATLAGNLVNPHQRRQYERIVTLAEACAEWGIAEVREQLEVVPIGEPENGDDITPDDEASDQSEDWSKGPQGAAMMFAAQADDVLRSLFPERQGAVWGSVKGIIAQVMLNAASDDDPKWFDGIIGNFERALANITKENDPQGWAIFTESLGLAHARHPGNKAANLEKAIACFNDLLSVKTVESDRSGWTTAMHNLGLAYLNREHGDREDNIERGIACYSSIVEAITLESDPGNWVDARLNLTRAYFFRLKGDPDDNRRRAHEYSEQVISVRTFEDTAEVHARTRDQLATHLSNLRNGDHDDDWGHAIELYIKALAFYTSEDYPADWARIKRNLANSYTMRRGGDRAENIECAIACCVEVLQLRNRAVTGWAATTCLLGKAYASRLKGDHVENLERAIELLEAGIEAWSNEGARRSFAISLNHLGEAYRKRIHGDRSDNIERAIEAFESALEVFDRERDPEDWASTQNHLGAAYTVRLRGDSEENLDAAIEHLKSSLQVHPTVADEINLGGVYLLIGGAEAIEVAISYFESALARPEIERDPESWASATANLAACYIGRESGVHSDNIEKAIEFLEKALTVQTEESDGPGWASNLLNLGSAYSVRECGDRIQNLNRALDYYRQARTAGGKFAQHVKLLQRYRAEAQTLLLLGRERWPEAAATLDLAMQEFAHRRVEMLTPESRREMFGALSSFGRWSAIIAVAEGDVARAIERIEASRGIALREALEIDDALSQHSDPEVRIEIERARRRIADLHAEIAMPPSAAAARPYKFIAAELGEAEAALEQAFGGRRQTISLNITEILAAIPPTSALIIPIATEFGGLVFVVPAGTSQVDLRHVVNCPGLTTGHVREQTAGWLTAYADMMLAHAERSPDFPTRYDAATVKLESVLDWLGQGVMGPALDRLAELEASATVDGDHTPELLIMPTGDFAVLPLHAAHRSHGGGRRTVLDDFVVSYTPSIYASRSRRQKGKGKPGGDRLLALVNPTGDLPFSEQLEIPALERLFSDRATILIGEQATKLALQQAAAEQTYLHLSCHGQFDWVNYRDPGLMLAGHERLSILDIVAGLKLASCRWVVLSACETGVMDVVEVPEETIGLPAAFQQAGASCVTATLWSVTDASSALFVRRAYEEHLVNGLSPPQAVRRAALWLRDLHAADVAPFDRDGRASGENMSSELRFGELRDHDGTFPRPIGSGDAAQPFCSPLIWAPYICWGN